MASCTSNLERVGDGQTGKASRERVSLCDCNDDREESDKSRHHLSRNSQPPVTNTPRMSHIPAADDSATEAPVGREDGVPHALALVEQAVSVRREPVLAVVRSDGGDSSKTLAEVVVDGRAIDRVQTLQLSRAVHVQALQCEENNLALMLWS